MRKIALAFLMFILSMPAMADTWIKFKATAVEDTINTLVAPERRQAAADEYQKQMNQTTGKISVMGIYKVCAAAGKDIRTNDGYTQCRYFINTIAEKSNFGGKSANKDNCASMFNGVWSITPDGKTYQCVGKDGHKLVYKKMCDIGTEGCIKQFAGLKTQGPAGREFIAEYAKIKNLNLTCKTGFETRRGWTSPLGQDYIQCSAGGKSYEFEFDSLNETPGNTSSEGENKAMCELFGGKIVKTPDSTVAKYWNSCDIAKDTCNGKLHALAIRIGHSTMYQGYCRLSREVQTKTVVGLHQIKGVDSYVFYKSGAQMRADMAKVQLEEYLRNTFPNESYITCDPTVKPLSGNGLGIDIDYVLSCTVGTQQVDFVFDDLTETSTKRAATGMDAMQCITSGGTFKGETCRGPTPAECTKLDAALRAKGSAEGAKWDEGARACILGNAMKTYKKDVVTGYVVGAVVIVGGALLVIGSDGLATPIVVQSAEMLLTDLAINWAIDANHRRLSNQAANRFGSFMDDAEKCNGEQCALNILKKHYATLSGVMGDLNKDDQATVDATMDRLIGFIRTEFVACGTDDAGQTIYANPADCAKQSSTLRAIDYIDKASEPVLIIGSIIYNPGYVSRRFVQMKQINKVADAMGVSYKEAKQIVKTGKLDNATDATKAITEIPAGRMRADLQEGKDFIVHPDGSVEFLNPNMAVPTTSNASMSLDDERNLLELQIFDTPEQFTEAELAVKRARLEEVNKSLAQPSNQSNSIKDAMKRLRNQSSQGATSNTPIDIKVDIPAGTLSAPTLNGSARANIKATVAEGRVVSGGGNIDIPAGQLAAINSKYTKGTSVDPDLLEDYMELSIDALHNRRVLSDSQETMGQFADVSTVINKDYAGRKGILFADTSYSGYIDDVIEQLDNGADNKKLITGVIDMTSETGKRDLARAVDLVKRAEVEDAVIPFAGPEHQMTLIKQGREWTVLDQYSTSDYNSVKNDVIGTLMQNKGANETVLINRNQVCNNENGTCALFSHAIGRQVLDGNINIANEVREMNQMGYGMRQNVVDALIDDVDRDIGLRILDIIEDD